MVNTYAIYRVNHTGGIAVITRIDERLKGTQEKAINKILKKFDRVVKIEVLKWNTEGKRVCQEIYKN